MVKTTEDKRLLYQLIIRYGYHGVGTFLFANMIMLTKISPLGLFGCILNLTSFVVNSSRMVSVEPQQPYQK
jgi:hypothetical protein